MRSRVKESERDAGTRRDAQGRAWGGGLQRPGQLRYLDLGIVTLSA